MKPRAGVSAPDRDAFITAFEAAVCDIPGVRAVRVGRRVTHGAQYEQQAPDAADFMVLMEFDDLGGLQTYLRHPAHEAVSRSFSRVLESGWAFDYESVDLASLRALGQRDGGKR